MYGTICVVTTGIHHITAIASDATQTLRFYSQILGLRLVKKTVNQDDVETYHLFFGDKLGNPGMDLTFFIFQPSQPGRCGNGLVTTISFAVPEESLMFWENRFSRFGVRHKSVGMRFNHKRLVFYDGDDLELELVGVPYGELDPTAQIWTTNELSAECAIRSFHSATLRVNSLASIEPVLHTGLGYERIATDGATVLYAIPNQMRAHLLEVTIDTTGMSGINAAGTVHHIAFRAHNNVVQSKLRQNIQALGIYTTDVINRYYFQSVYFRTPAGILFEIATDGPGFTADEKPELLGTALSLPPFLEPQRMNIEQNLPRLDIA